MSGFDESASETRTTPAKLHIGLAMMTRGTVLRLPGNNCSNLLHTKCLDAKYPPYQKGEQACNPSCKEKTCLGYGGCIPLVLESTVLLPMLVYFKEALTVQLATNHRKQKAAASCAIWIVVRGASEGWSVFSAPSASARSASDGLLERTSCVKLSALLPISDPWELRTCSFSGMVWYSSCDCPFCCRSLQALNANGRRYRVNELVLRYVSLYFTSANVQKTYTRTRTGTAYHILLLRRGPA